MSGGMGGGMSSGGGLGGNNEDEESAFPVYKVKRHEFVIQFIWKPTLLKDRIAMRKVRLEAEAEAKRQAEEAAKQGQDGGPDGPDGPSPDGPDGVAMKQ